MVENMILLKLLDEVYLNEFCVTTFYRLFHRLEKDVKKRKSYESMVSVYRIGEVAIFTHNNYQRNYL